MKVSDSDWNVKVKNILVLDEWVFPTTEWDISKDHLTSTAWFLHDETGP